MINKPPKTNHAPASLMFDGDANACAEWVPYARVQLSSMRATTHGTTHRVISPKEGVEIHLSAITNSILIKAGANINVVYWYKLSAESTYAMKGAIYAAGKKPPFAIAPISSFALENSNVDASVSQYSDGFYSEFKSNKGVALFNGQSNIASVFRAGGTTTRDRKIVISGMPQGSSVTSTGTSIVADAIMLGTHSFTLSVSNFADQTTAYLDKITGATLVNKMKIECEGVPQKLIITTYHDDLGEIVTDLSSEIPTLSNYDNPRVLTGIFSPDGKYLTVVLHQGYSDDTDLIIDIVIALDSNGVKAFEESLSHIVSSNLTPSTGVANKSDYVTAINANQSFYISAFKFENRIEETIEISDNTLTSGYIDATSAISVQVTHTQAGMTGYPTPQVVVEQGILNVGSYEIDFEALVQFPIVSASYSYDIAETSCFTSVDLVVTIPIFGVPTSVNVSASISSFAQPDIRNIKWTRNTGNIVTSYSVVEKGSAVAGCLYGSKNTETGEYERYWIDVVSEFQDKLEAKVSTNIKSTVDYDYKEVTVGVSYSSNTLMAYAANPGSYITAFSSGTIDDMISENAGKRRTTTIEKDARLVYRLLVNNINVPKLFGSIILDTGEITETKYEINYSYSGVFSPIESLYDVIVPLYKILSNVTVAKKTSQPFMKLLSANAVGAVNITKYDKKINVTTGVTIENLWNEEVNATFSSGGIPDAFTNGIQITHVSKEKDYKFNIKNNNIGNPTIDNIFTSSTVTQTTSAPAAIVPELSSMPIVNSGYSIATTTESVSFNKIISSGTIASGLYLKLTNQDYVSYFQTGFGVSGALPGYAVIMNGQSISDLEAIPAFASFANGAIFGVGFGI